MRHSCTTSPAGCNWKGTISSAGATSPLTTMGSSGSSNGCRTAACDIPEEEG
ncbi:hypothetical protein [uncultured Chitinophaga sp.]|uniref:hypothetical protein n=1 Tax=uncultured Chitinophaga sp. TaxID=339340 RepID=UPI00262F7CB7|nr:hypothetical protein [uncultured Chitinophaga sp.]